MYNFSYLHKILGSTITYIYHPKIILIFSFFGKVNALKFAVYLLTCQYFSNMEKFVPQESSIEFCRIFIVRVKEVCYERKAQGELLGTSIYCTLEWLCPCIPTTSFRLVVLRNRVECLLQ